MSLDSLLHTSLLNIIGGLGTYRATNIHVLLHLNEKGRVWADIVICTTIDCHQDPPPFLRVMSPSILGPYKEMHLIVASPAHGVVVVPPMRQAMTRC